MPWHVKAAGVIGNLAQSSTPWAIPWPCLHEFFGVVTNRRVFGVPTPFDIVCGQIEAWMESPVLMMLGETSTHWTTLKEVIGAGKTLGPAVHDARIAAICEQHGVKELWSADRDFSRFPKLRVRNPLI